MRKFLNIIVVLLMFGFPWRAVAEEMIVTVHSANGQFYARSVPARDMYGSCLGRTEVYRSQDSSCLYTIQKNLTDGYLFLSNDGRVLVHLLLYEPSPNDEPVFRQAVTIYEEGYEQTRYRVCDLIDCNVSDGKYLFPYIPTSFGFDFDQRRAWLDSLPSFDSVVLRRPAYNMCDTVMFYTSDHRLVVMPMQGCGLSYRSYDSIPLERLLQVPHLREEDPFKCPSAYLQLANTELSEEVEEYIASELGMVKRRYVWYDEYKYYYIRLFLRVGRDGKATIDSTEGGIEVPDGISERRVRRIVERMRFYTGDFPEGIDCWYQSTGFFVRKKNRWVSRRERDKERVAEEAENHRRLTADSIGHVYIPRDLEESFCVLDTMLTGGMRGRLRGLPNRKETVKYHFGLGTWMRNNWGLWGGSRLQKYFEDRGVYHPDGMSGKLMEYYYDYLHGEDTGWRRFDTTLVPPPSPDTATRAVIRYVIKDRELKRILDNLFKEEEGDDLVDPVFLVFDEDCVGTLCAEFELEDSGAVKEGSIAMFVATYDKPAGAVVYGYCIYRGHSVFLCGKEMGSPYFRRTKRELRFHHSLWNDDKRDGSLYRFVELYLISGRGWMVIVDND